MLNNESSQKLIVKRKNKVPIFLIVALITMCVFSTVFAVTYAYLTDSKKTQASFTFGVLTVGVNYTDKSKESTTFGAVVVGDLVPGEDIPLKGSITGLASEVNDLSGDSSVDSYLRLSFGITSYEDDECTVPVSDEIQEEFDAVAKNVEVLETSKTWIKSADNYVYYVGGDLDSENPLKWGANYTLELNGEISVNFPSSFFSNAWQARNIYITLYVEAFQYNFLDVDTSLGVEEQANCASSVILDYNQTTGLSVEERIIDTSYCITDKSSFAKDTEFSTSITGDLESLRIFSSGKKLTLGKDYTLNSNTLTVKPINSSLLVVCSPQKIKLVDESDSSTVYQTITLRDDGSIPKYITIPEKDLTTYVGYYTSPNGAGTLVYGENGTREITQISNTTLYAHFKKQDVIVTYRNSHKYFEGDDAFTNAWSFANQQTAYSVTITICRDFTLTTTYYFTASNMLLSVQSIEKSTNSYYTLTFAPTTAPASGCCFSAQSSISTGSTLEFKHINLIMDSSSVGNGRLAIIGNNNLTISEKTTVSGFNNAKNGGAIWAYYNAVISINGSSSGDAKDVVFDSCASTGSNNGGVIGVNPTNKGCEIKIVIVNAEFKNCSSEGSGGVIFMYGETGRSVETTISDCVMHDNTATGSGGAIFVEGPGCVLNIESGKFYNNAGAVNGGVIEVELNAKINISGGEFYSNKATSTNASGGVLSLSGSIANISGGVFGDSSATTVATSSVCSNNSSGGGGAVFASYSSTLNIFSTAKSCPLFAYNYGGENAAWSGGAIGIIGLSALNIYKESNATSSPEFRYNYSARGGAINAYNHSTSGTSSSLAVQEINITNAYIHHNKSPYGGAIFSRAQNNYNINELVFNDGVVVQNNVATTMGGVMDSAGGIYHLTINGGDYSYNSAPRGGVMNIDINSEIVINNGNFSNNSLTGGNSGGAFDLHSGTLTINGGTFSNNTSTANGGAFYVYGSSSNLIINSGTISNNTASSSGGAICISGGNLTINGGVITGNTANSGGGVYVSSGVVTMNNGVISKNTSSSSGGGISASGSSSTLTINNGTISENTANSGGGIYSSNTNLTIKNCSILKNSAIVSVGGGLCFINNSNENPLELNGNILFSNNSATTYGGAIYVQGTRAELSCKNVTICNNSCANGAGISMSSDSKNLILGGSQVRIYNNTATSNGGAIILNALYSSSAGTAYSASMTMNSGYIYGNTATNGGAIYVETATHDGIEADYGTITVNSGLIYNNTATDSGGAIYATSGSIVTINNGSIYGNTANGEASNNETIKGGGGLFIASSLLTINDGQIGGDTFEKANSAPKGYGGAICLQGSSSILITAGVIGTTKANSNATATGCSNYALSGGGLYINASSTLTVNSATDKNPTFGWNYATLNGLNVGGGGAIKSFGSVKINESSGSLDYSNSVNFSYNGAVSRGADIYIPNATAFIAKNTTFSYGAGVHLRLDNVPTLIEYCYFLGGGAGVHSPSGVVTVNASTFASIRSNNGILGEGSTIYLTGCKFFNNSKAINVSSGKVYLNGDENEIYSNDVGIITSKAGAVVEIQGGKIHDNGSISVNGGAISIVEGGTANIYGCEIYSNTANLGGGIYNAGTLYLQNTTIRDNVANSGGGGVYTTETGKTYMSGLRGSSVYSASDLTSWTQYYNASTATMSATYENNQTTITGKSNTGWDSFYSAGINLTAGKQYLISMDYDIPTTFKIFGFSAYFSAQIGVQLQLLKTTPSNNDNFANLAGGDSTVSSYGVTGVKDGEGRLMFAFTCDTTQDYYLNLVVDGLSNSTSQTFYVKEVSITEYDSTKNVSISNNTCKGNSNSASGGGISNQGVTSAYGVSIRENKVEQDHNGGGVWSVSNTMQLINCQVSNNILTSSTGGGGGIYVKDSQCIIGGGTSISGNTSSYAGGGMYLQASSSTAVVYFLGANIFDNKAVIGAGVNAYNSQVYMLSANVYGNVATQNGGGIRVKGSSSLAYLYNEAKIGGENSSTANKAQNGGGIYIEQSSTVNIYGSTIGASSSNSHATNESYGNYASESGGGIYWSSGTLNIATYDNGYDHHFNHLTENSLISYNYAASSGGGIYTLGTVNLEDVKLINNASINGGGVYASGSSCALTLSGAEISQNYAQSSGGAVYINGALNSAVTFSAGTVSLNTTADSGCGGAFYLKNGANLTMTGTASVSSNTSGYGGGIYAEGSTTISIASGTSVTTNTAKVSGGGIYKFSTTTATISTNTVSGNSPDNTFTKTD